MVRQVVTAERMNVWMRNTAAEERLPLPVSVTGHDVMQDAALAVRARFLAAETVSWRRGAREEAHMLVLYGLMEIKGWIYGRKSGTARVKERAQLNIEIMKRLIV